MDEVELLREKVEQVGRNAEEGGRKLHIMVDRDGVIQSSCVSKWYPLRFAGDFLLLVSLKPSNGAHQRWK